MNKINNSLNQNKMFIKRLSHYSSRDFAQKDFLLGTSFSKLFILKKC